MSLLDFKMPGLDTAEGQGIMAAALSLLQAQKMPGQRGLAGALGGAGQQYMQTSGQARQQAMQSKLQGAQLAQYEAVSKKQQEEADREKQMRELYARYATPGQRSAPGTADVNAALPPEMQIGALPPMQGKQAGYDYAGLANGMAAIDPIRAFELQSKFNPTPKYEAVAPGSSMYKMGPNGPELAFTAPKTMEPKSLPAAVQEYEYAKDQGYKGTFEQWDTARKRAGATNLSVNTDNLGLKPKDRFDMEQKLSADYQKATGTDNLIVSGAQDINNILKQGGALKDQAAIYKFARSLDPEGAVREADYAAIVRTAGGLDYVKNLFKRAVTGEQLSETQRSEMSSLINSMAGVAKQRIAKKQKTFAGNAKMYNLEPANIFQSAEPIEQDGWGITKVP